MEEAKTVANVLKAEDLVPYTVDDVIKAFESAPHRVLRYMWYSNVHPVIECIDYQKKCLLGFIKSGTDNYQKTQTELENEITTGNYTSVVREEYGMVSNLYDACSALEKAYVSELESDLGAEAVKWLEQERYKKGEKENYNLKNINDRAELIKAINNFYERLLICARYQLALLQLIPSRVEYYDMERYTKAATYLPISWVVTGKEREEFFKGKPALEKILLSEHE